MIKKQINIDLNASGSIENAIQELESFKKEINSKITTFVSKLADIGIRVAEQSADNEYKPYITFSKAIVDEREGFCEICMYGMNTEQMQSEWFLKGGVIKTVFVDALMMNEVGSGWFADNPDGLSNAGQGTFPGQTHARDLHGWFWVDASGTHHSFGRNGHLSMHQAFIEMSQEIDRVASEVFR